MYFVKKKGSFCAAHRLYSPELTEEENRWIYGKCSNPNFHGHNYEVVVTIGGEINKGTGMTIDFRELEKLLQEEVIRHVDHKNLNLEVDFLRGIVPTAENLAYLFFQRLEPRIKEKGYKLISVSVSEKEENIAIYSPSQINYLN